MNANEPNHHAAPGRDADGPQQERRFARRIDCTPCERPVRAPAPNHAGTARDPRDAPHP